MNISDYAVAEPWIFEAEGGYVNDKVDRGGATIYGISFNFLKRLEDDDGDGFVDGDIDKDGDVDSDDIKHLTRDAVNDIYRKYFWNAARCGEMPLAQALCLFDARVNHRPKTAAKLVQRALGVKMDGIIGAHTIKIANNNAARLFLPNYFSYRAQLYADIVRMDSSQARFERGWYRRLFLLHAFILGQHEGS